MSILFKDLSTPSLEYSRDIQIFDDTPWEEHGTIDLLVDLQQQAFQADRLGDCSRFGSLVMQMSSIEHEIGNHLEAAAYANEAAEAFERAGHTGEAIAARSTIAKEYRTLYSPNLALASLQDVLSLRTTLSGSNTGLNGQALDADIQPVLRFISSFTCTYLSSGLVDVKTGDEDYPAPYLPKTPHPSRDAAEGLLHAFDQLLEIPVAIQREDVRMSLFFLSAAYSHLGERRLGLKKVDRKAAKGKSEALGRLSFNAGVTRLPRATKLFDGTHGVTLNDILHYQ